MSMAKASWSWIWLSRQKKELVWRATVMAILRGSQEKNFELVNKRVAKAFEAYPPAKKK